MSKLMVFYPGVAAMPDPILATPVETPMPERPDLYVAISRSPREKHLSGEYATTYAMVEMRFIHEHLIFLLPGTARLAEMKKRDEAMERLGMALREWWSSGTFGTETVIRCEHNLRAAAREAGLMETQDE